ncbi:MAG: hypothetical protein ACRC8Y_22130 [Chroococcales cyanobacterium]
MLAIAPSEQDARTPPEQRLRQGHPSLPKPITKVLFMVRLSDRAFDILRGEIEKSSGTDAASQIQRQM